jgi:hypothetical protein
MWLFNIETKWTYQSEICSVLCSLFENTNKPIQKQWNICHWKLTEKPLILSFCHSLSCFLLEWNCQGAKKSLSLDSLPTKYHGTTNRICNTQYPRPYFSFSLSSGFAFCLSFIHLLLWRSFYDNDEFDVRFANFLMKHIYLFCHVCSSENLFLKSYCQPAWVHFMTFQLNALFHLFLFVVCHCALLNQSPFFSLDFALYFNRICCISLTIC